MQLKRSKWKAFYEGLIEWIIRICGISAVVLVFSIFIFVFWEGKGLLFSDNFSVWELLTSEKWDPTHEPASFGAARIILGTFSVAILAMTIAVPFSLAGAIFISEFCGSWLKEILKVVIELLAAIPSVVWGFIGLTVMSIFIRDLGSNTGLSVLNGAIILALMSMPIILSISEDALKAVPDSYREAAIGLGVTRWQMVYRVLLPGAKKGLLAAVLLGMGRVVGETMAVLMATGHALNNPFDTNPPFFHALMEVKTLTATIASEMGEVERGGDHWQVLFLLGILLFTITFVVNMTAHLVVHGVKRK
ncbi:phosphate ABC transporter permease subunit PstC [bacterium]|jgi:phosphate transport system permease protein|nr:phosphate ABC transporter permease subunit PstC [bacterium]MDA7679989.1 phosphate ABC transporter permease subunit PstC [bacterium]MDB4684004.1 phosphate ABC transporter permease subunit PstC [bacterium]MDC0309437.1 phosphate ABC transporter permease subunit PstC [bacterium]